jgi:hypothetical protein
MAPYMDGLAGGVKHARCAVVVAGIDDTYSSMKHQDDDPLGNAFDITRPAAVCIKLKRSKLAKSLERG